MTGHRRDSGKPVGAVGTAEKSYRHFEWRQELSSSPAHRVYAAAHYLRAVLARADPGLAVPVVEEILAAMVRAARELDGAAVAAAQRRRERRRVDDNRR